MPEKIFLFDVISETLASLGTLANSITGVDDILELRGHEELINLQVTEFRLNESLTQLLSSDQNRGPMSEALIDPYRHAALRNLENH